MSYDARRIIIRGRVHHEEAMELLDMRAERPLRVARIEELRPMIIVGRGRCARLGAPRRSDLRASGPVLVVRRAGVPSGVYRSPSLRTCEHLGVTS